MRRECQKNTPLVWIIQSYNHNYLKRNTWLFESVVYRVDGWWLMVVDLVALVKKAVLWLVVIIIFYLRISLFNRFCIIFYKHFGFSYLFLVLNWWYHQLNGIFFPIKNVDLMYGVMYVIIMHIYIIVYIYIKYIYIYINWFIITLIWLIGMKINVYGISLNK